MDAWGRVALLAYLEVRGWVVGGRGIEARGPGNSDILGAGGFPSGGGIVRCVFCDGGLCPLCRSYFTIRLVAPRCAVSPLNWIVSGSGHARLWFSAQFRLGSYRTMRVSFSLHIFKSVCVMFI